MACLDDEDLAAYVGGAAGPDTVARVDAHIDACASCRRLFVAVVFGTPSAAPTRLEPAGAPQSPARSAFERGGTILGKYRIERVLGEGGMGRVFLARDGALDRSVAIKVMRDDLALDPTARARFEREARMIARLANEHVVRVHDVGSLGPLPFIVMEYVEGVDLRTRVKEGGPLAPRLAARCVRDACEALAEAHRAGIVHRDVKPQNLLLSSDGRVKVVDFGIAKQAAEGPPVSRVGTVLGTIAFMAPEQLAGGSVDARADVWALGATLHWLVTGRPPFDDAARARPAPRLDDPRLDAIVARCLAKDPAERWASAADLADALDRYLAPPPSRRPAAIAMACASFAGAAVVTWLALHRPKSPAPASSPPPAAASAPSSLATPAPSSPPSVVALAASAPPSALAVHARCACVADGRRLCKPELVEARCECHDAFGAILFSKREDVGRATSALRTLARRSPAAAEGQPCAGFSAEQSKGETTFHAEAGDGTLHPCSQACADSTAFSGGDRGACSGVDDDGRSRGGVLRCD